MFMEQEKVWDLIARDWSRLRKGKFKEVYWFISKYVRGKGKVLEIGCGNGRNLIPFIKKGFEAYGIDFSSEMLKEARKFCPKAKYKKSDMRKLPFEDNYFDYVLSIASLHHVRKSEEALREMKRVMKDDGMGLITVWNKWQGRFLFKKKESYIKFGKYRRYYYLYNYFELMSLVNKAGFNVVKSRGIFRKNLVFVVEKKV